MQRSIIFKYFTIYLALVLLSIAVLGAGIMAFATMYFKDENYQQLEVCAQKGSWQITQLLDENTVLDQDLVTDYLSVMASSVSGELLLSDLDGTLLLSSQPDSPLVGEQVDSRILDQLRLDGSYREMGYLGGLFPAHYNTVALPIYDQSQQPIGYFFACAPAGEPLNSFLLDFLQVFSVGVGDCAGRGVGDYLLRFPAAGKTLAADERSGGQNEQRGFLPAADGGFRRRTGSAGSGYESYGPVPLFLGDHAPQLYL